MPTKKKSTSLMTKKQQIKPADATRPKTGEIKFTGKDVTVGAQRMTPNKMAQKIDKKYKEEFNSRVLAKKTKKIK